MKSLRIYIIVLAALIVVYLVAQYNRPKAVDWTETYSSADKIPYGTYVVYNRLQDIFPKAKIETFREPVYNVINDHKLTHGAYLIICDEIEMNEYDYQKLIKFIKNGNDVFIGASYFGQQLGKNLKVETSSEFKNIQSSTAIKFSNKFLDSSRYYTVGKSIGIVYFSRFDTTKSVSLGANVYHHSNFLKYALGKGNLYLNANPLMFTNYSLLSKDGNEYASKALSNVKNDDYVIWDRYYSTGREDENSTIRFFLRNDALRWAFYISFFGLILFVLYEVKRRQRIIPVIEPLENATLSFVNVVGQVYYEQHDNQNIAGKKIQYFLEHLRARYTLKTNPLDQLFVEGFSQKTNIDPAFATELINYINMLSEDQKVTDKQLIMLNQLIEKFYNQSK